MIGAGRLLTVARLHLNMHYHLLGVFRNYNAGHINNGADVPLKDAPLMLFVQNNLKFE